MGIISKIAHFLGKKKPYPGTQDDRDLGGYVTTYKWQLKKERMDLEHDIEMLKLQQKQQFLLRQLGYIEEEMDPNDPDFLIQNLLVKAFSNPGQKQATNPQMNPAFDYWTPQQKTISQPQQVSINEDQFEEIWDRIPADQKPLIKQARADEIRSWIAANYPQIDPNTRERAIAFVRSQ